MFFHVTHLLLASSRLLPRAGLNPNFILIHSYDSLCRTRCYNLCMKKKKQEELGYTRSLTQKGLEEEFMEILQDMEKEDMGKEWEDKLDKYLDMMLHSKDKESQDEAQKALKKLMDEKEKKYPTQQSPTKKLGFSRPMFSEEEELRSEEYAEKAAKKMNKALSNKEE